MAAPTSSAISFKKTLANTEPSTHGTFQPVVDPSIYVRCQGNSCHWMQVRLIYAQELPFRMPCRIAVLDPNWPLCVLPLSIERLTLSYMYGSSSFE